MTKSTAFFDLVRSDSWRLCNLDEFWEVVKVFEIEGRERKAMVFFRVLGLGGVCGCGV